MTPTAPPSLFNLATVLDIIRQVDEDLTVLRLAILLDIHAHEGTAYHEVGNRLDIRRSSLSRNISRLDTFGYSQNRKGLGLVHTEEDPENRRQRLCYLTPEGKRLVQRITKTLS